jgi:hypothetical protein
MTSVLHPKNPSVESIIFCTEISNRDQFNDWSLLINGSLRVHGVTAHALYDSNRSCVQKPVQHWFYLFTSLRCRTELYCETVPSADAR